MKPKDVVAEIAYYQSEAEEVKDQEVDKPVTFAARVSWTKATAEATPLSSKSHFFIFILFTVTAISLMLFTFFLICYLPFIFEILVLILELRMSFGLSTL